MGGYLKLKKNKENYELNLFYSKTSKSHYNNFIDKDPHKLAQILIDLIIDGFPVEKAIKVMRQRIKRKEWMGL